MLNVRKNKDKIFAQVIKQIDRNIKLSTDREAKIIALCFELSFGAFIRHAEKEIKIRYIKRKTPIKSNGSNRLRSIVD